MLVIILGGWVGYVLAGFVFGDDLFSVFFYRTTSFSGSMWYIPFLSTYSVSFWPLELGYRATRVFDSGWIEYFGGQGVYWVFFNFSRVNQWFQYNGLRVFLGFFVMWVFILLFIFVYYLDSLLIRARH